MTATSKKPLFDLRYALLVVLQVIILLWLGYMHIGSQQSRDQDMLVQHYRNVAAKLHGAGLTEQAAVFYEKFLRNYPDDRESAAKMAFSIAELYEQSGRLREALAWYYQVELYDQKSSVRDQASERIVSLLERLGKTSAAKYAMAKETALKIPSEANVQGAVVVAKIGNKKIYLHQIHEAMDSLPSQVRQNFQTREGQLQFLKKYVADVLLYEKALRLQYQDKSDHQKKLEQIRKQLLIQKVIEEEVAAKVRVDASDVKNYYEANLEKYVDQEKADVSMIKLKSRKQAEELIGKLKKGLSFDSLAKKHSIDAETAKQGGRLATPIVGNRPFGVHKAEVVQQIMKVSEGRWTQPILSSGAYYIFSVNKKFAKKVPTFDQVKGRVQYDYQMEKTQGVYQKLIEDTLSTEKIELFADNLKVGS